MGKVAVLGGGSLGLLLAGKLQATSGSDCELWTRTSNQADLLNLNGITLQDSGGCYSDRVHPVARSLDNVGSFGEGIVLLTVKQTALTSDFLERLAAIVPSGGMVVLFQNGIGHRELLREALPNRSLAVAVTTEGALRVDATTVRHTGSGETRIGVDDETDAKLLFSLERMLKQAGFSVFLSKQLEGAIMRKLLINAVINPLTAILRVRNGELAATSERLALMKALFQETYGILSDFGLDDETGLWNAVLQVCSATRDNESSMLQDVIAHKETEIEFINGAICRMASRQGKVAHWNETVTALVKAIY
ncbi:ketopantoate reductase family protein [Cohnella luojiensis]|uniref:2-dehydropantoate 2-reductase n=1 Tax=Cohnella luojiensis TaxID=652876 RepID=A0A4Y8M7D0_9BACL|nr:2-dehydropantoate 2-reductase [Cohnella luojiensis]TFE31722.1 2-dehydropantoate 2-reductase [Cohnella luojiensis]